MKQEGLHIFCWCTVMKCFKEGKHSILIILTKLYTKQDYVILHGCHKVLRIIQISLSLPPLQPPPPSSLLSFHPGILALSFLNSYSFILPVFSGSLLWDLSNNSMPGNTEYCILLSKGMLVGKHDLNSNIRFKHCLL